MKKLNSNLKNDLTNESPEGLDEPSPVGDTIKVKAKLVLRTTAKAVLISNDNGQAWIPLSLIVDHKHKPNKKNPWRFKVKSFFKINYAQSDVFKES